MMTGATTQSDFRERRLNIRKDVGTWLYNKASFDRYCRWCEENHVRARGNVKITTTEDQARCLRVLKPIAPGQAIVTAPISSTINFLTISRRMFDVPNTFPLQCSWMNWNERMHCLPGAAVHEMVTAGWMGRTISQSQQADDPMPPIPLGDTSKSSFMQPPAPAPKKENQYSTTCSPVNPRATLHRSELDGRDPHETYMRWLVQDTTGRDGAMGGISRERGDKSTVLDDILMSMCNDAGEEPDIFMEHFFRLIAAIALRTQPLDERAIALQLPGTNFWKATSDQLFVPTFVPLVDCVPHREDGSHNTLLDFYIPTDFMAAGQGNRDFEADPSQLPAGLSKTTVMGNSEEADGRRTLREKMELRRLQRTDADVQALISELQLPTADLIGPQAGTTTFSGGGMFALRALRELSPGDLLTIRGWPKTPDKDQEGVSAMLMEQSRQINNMKV